MSPCNERVELGRNSSELGGHRTHAIVGDLINFSSCQGNGNRIAFKKHIDHVVVIVDRTWPIIGLGQLDPSSG
jgi:hypothetical protein